MRRRTHGGGAARARLAGPPTCQRPRASSCAPPEGCAAWFTKTFRADESTVWSGTAAGALSFKKDVYEIFFSKDLRKPAFLNALVQDFKSSAAEQVKKSS